MNNIDNDNFTIGRFMVVQNLRLTKRYYYFPCVVPAKIEINLRPFLGVCKARNELSNPLFI